jgi:hypothetical protein
VNSINERLRVVNIAPSKTPKTLRDRYIKNLSLIKLSTGLERVLCLRQRCIPNILLILLEPYFSEVQLTEDLSTHWSLRSDSDRPYPSLVVHSSGDGSRVITKAVFPFILHTIRLPLVNNSTRAKTAGSIYSS